MGPSNGLVSYRFVFFLLADLNSVWDPLNLPELDDT